MLNFKMNSNDLKTIDTEIAPCSSVSFIYEVTHYLVFLFMLSLISACTPSKETSHEEKLQLQGEEAAAQFIVVSESAHSVPQSQEKISKNEKTGQIDNYWRMERFRDYTFTVCISDRNKSLLLRRQKFSVDTFQGTYIDPTGDDGCFRWSETLEYNYFADATYVLLKRKLTGVGAYQGFFNLEIAVNPWATRDGTGQEVVFLKPKRGNVPSLVKDPILIRETLLGKGQKKTLLLKDLKIQLTEKGSKSLNLTEMKPQANINEFFLWLQEGVLHVKTFDVTGKHQEIPIKDGGHFRVFSRLLQHNSQYNKGRGKIEPLDKFLNREAPSVVLNAQGFIKSSLTRQTSIDEHLRLQIHKEMFRNWDEEPGWLALRIQPLNFPFGDFFEQFEAIYDVGLLKSIHNVTSAYRMSMESDEYSKIVKEGWNTFDKILSSNEISPSNDNETSPTQASPPKTGSPQVSPTQASPPKTGSPQVSPAQASPPKTGSPQVSPAQASPPKTGSPQVSPAQVPPPKTGPPPTLNKVDEATHGETQQARPRDNEDFAQFIVVSAHAESAPQSQVKISEDRKTGQINDYWRIERFRDYLFTACIKHRHEPRQLKNQKFSVNTLQGTYTDHTGDNGCFRWTETLEYNYFADATYVLLKRKLTGVGTYQGFFNLEIAVNPWATRDGTGQEVVFLKPKRGIIPKKKGGVLSLVKNPALIQEALLGRRQKKTLVLKGLKVQLREKGDKSLSPTEKASEARKLNEFFLWLREGILHVETFDVTGKRREIPIKDGGHFRVFSRLIQYNKTNGKIDSLDKILDEPPPSVVLNAEGFIKSSPTRQASIDEHLRLQIHKEMSRNWGEKPGWLALRVQPLNFPFGGEFFNTLEAIYEVGPLPSIHKVDLAYRISEETLKDGITFDKIFSSKLIHEDQFVESDTGIELLKLSGQLKPFRRYDFTTMDPRFEKNKRGESATTRGVDFRVHTCLTNKADGSRPEEGDIFIVTVRNWNSGKETVYHRDIKSDGKNRCLSIVHYLWFKNFKQERLFSFNLEFREKKLGNAIVGTSTISINPWDPGWTFGRDGKKLTPTYLAEVIESEKIPSRFYLPRFAYETLRFKYSIDKFLNLRVRKSVLLHLQPTMMRYHSIEKGRLGLLPLRDGIYLMKAAMEKHYLDPTTHGVVAADTLRTGESVNRLTLKSEDGEIRKKHHISIVKRLVRVTDGQIIAPVEFSVLDLRIMRIRAQMMIQLQPVEEWRHYVVKLYDDFYERQMVEIRKFNGLLTTWDAFEALQKEKINNIEIIIKAMSENERMIHDLIEEKYEDGVINQRKHKVDSQFYKECYGMPEVTWDDIFKLFNLEHRELSRFLGGSLADRDRALMDNSEIHNTGYKDSEGKDRTCYRPYNVVRPLILNDFMDVSLRPIDDLDLDHFVDSYESSGLDKETFFGPLTFLLNGNSSHMRSTRNISEVTCRTSDCDEIKNKERLRKLRKLRDREKAARDAWKKITDQNLLDDVYEHSKFFNSMRYINNMHVDDLIPQMEEVHRLYRIYNEAYSQVYNYLRIFDFDFVSTVDEPLYEVDIPKCQEELGHLQSVDSCLKQTEDRQIMWQGFSHNWGEFSDDPDMKKHVEDLAGHLKLSEPLAKKFCYDFSLKLFSEHTKGLKPGENFSDPDGSHLSENIWDHSWDWDWAWQILWDSFHNHCQHSFRLTKEQIKQCGNYLAEDQRVKCEGRERTYNFRRNFHIERKLRVKETGKYFFRGGKSQNINVGSSFSANFYKSLTNSWMGSFSGGSVRSGVVKKLQSSVSQAIGEMPLLSGVANATGLEFRVTYSESNSKSDGIIMNEQVFLVMQDVVMDIELLDYVKCVSISLNLNSSGIGGIGRIIEEVINKYLLWGMAQGRIRRSDLESARQKYLLDLRRGLFICDQRESDKYKDLRELESLAVREHYAYIDQHFVSGDLQDAANIYNHPWLYQIRGQTDIQRFLGWIKARPQALSSGLSPTGQVAKGHRWPLRKLSDVYFGIIPTFPGIYTMLHNEYEYTPEFPWRTPPKNSFEPLFLKSLLDDDSLSFSEQRARKLSNHLTPDFIQRNGGIESIYNDFKNSFDNYLGETGDDLDLLRILGGPVLEYIRDQMPEDPKHTTTRTCEGDYTIRTSCEGEGDPSTEPENP